MYVARFGVQVNSDSLRKIAKEKIRTNPMLRMRRFGFELLEERRLLAADFPATLIDADSTIDSALLGK